MPDLPGSSYEIDEEMFNQFLDHDVDIIQNNKDKYCNYYAKYNLYNTEIQADQ